MVSVVRPGDTRKGLGRLGVFFGVVVGAPEVAPEALWVVGVKVRCFLDPVDALLGTSQPSKKFALLYRSNRRCCPAVMLITILNERRHVRPITTV
jgi:hypothetical protein